MLAQPLFVDEEPQAPTAAAPPPTGNPVPVWYARIGLGVVMLISVVLNFYQLGQTGFGNAYYAAGVRSMLDNLHNFFFVSYDPGGFVTIDKPPLGFWLQTISAKIFGFTAFSVFLPQALAGVISVWLLYLLVQRHFGRVAGIIAGLALALSPISVATNRNNTIDSTLVLTLLVAAWALMRAAESGKLGWLLLSGILIGLGFNIKMLEAYLVVPAFGLVYMLGAPGTWRTRVLHLVAAAGAMVGVSLAWVVTVDLIPASLRPYVGSSQDNSELSLALGYNGITRLLGQFFGTSRGNNGAGATGGFPGGGQSTGSFPGGGRPTGGFPGGTPPTGIDFPRGNPSSGFPAGGPSGGNGGGIFNTGVAGPFRLFIEPLGSQIGWFLPLALTTLVALGAEWRWRLRTERQNLSLMLWGGWLLTMGIFFSVAGFFHEYYLTMMAPAIAALVGIGLVTLWRHFQSSGWLGWLLPIGIALTTIEQIVVMVNYPQWSTTMVLVDVLGFGTALVLVGARFLKNQAIPRQRLLGIAAVGVLALFVIPAIWSAGATLAGAQNLPVASLPSSTSAASPGGQVFGNTTNSALITYLEQHRGTATYLVATQSSMTADSIILATNVPVMSIGGFSGSDPILTATSIAQLASSGQVKYFLIGGFGGPNGNATSGSGQASAISWIEQNCTAVPASDYQGTSSSTTGGFGGGETLYVYNGTAASK